MKIIYITWPSLEYRTVWFPIVSDVACDFLLESPTQYVQQGCLPTAGWTHEGQNLPWCNRRCHSVENVFLSWAMAYLGNWTEPSNQRLSGWWYVHFVFHILKLQITHTQACCAKHKLVFSSYQTNQKHNLLDSTSSSPDITLAGLKWIRPSSALELKLHW